MLLWVIEKILKVKIKKSILLLLVIISIANYLQISNKICKSMTVFKTYQNLVNAIFKAANDKIFKVLNNLFNPTGDEDTRMIYSVEYSEQSVQNEFFYFFKDGYISRNIIYEDENNASVPIMFGVGGNGSGNMKVIKRKDKWFLLNF